MYKLLIVDDEPLVQVGIKSMVNWNELDIEVTGSATNGQLALNMMETQLPDIVITDIKMPVMSGLELIRCCREHYGNEHPCFIILTSYEDFHMVKEAITYQVTDYLVKLELTPENLKDAISRVKEKLQKTAAPKTAENLVRPYYDKFFIRLINNLFESEEQFRLQSLDLKLDFHYQGYVCCYGVMNSPETELSLEKQLALFSSSMQMLKELAAKYHPCYCLALDTRHFALLLCYETFPEDTAAESEELSGILQSISDTLVKYYNVSFRCGIGTFTGQPLALSDSYQCSRQACQLTDDSSTVVCFETASQRASSHSSFNISLFRESLTKAFEEYDASALSETLDSLCELFLAHPNHYVQAMDGACNILFLAISLLQDGDQIVSEFFSDSSDGYRSIYRQATVEQVVSWLSYFKDQLCRLFDEHHRDYKNHIVTNVKKYIGQHLSEKLSLNEVAAVFGISPNYLSQLFGKYNDSGFSEYINLCKVNEAKHLLDEGNLKIYEVAERLGFESSFYFSKVFKKIEGVSPTDYVSNRKL